MAATGGEATTTNKTNNSIGDIKHMTDNERFTQIPNSLLEAISYQDLSGSEANIIFLVIRHTYGFHQDKKELSLSKIQENTGLSKRQVMRAMELVK